MLVVSFFLAPRIFRLATGGRQPSPFFLGTKIFFRWQQKESVMAAPFFLSCDPNFFPLATEGKRDGRPFFLFCDPNFFPLATEGKRDGRPFFLSCNSNFFRLATEGKRDGRSFFFSF